MTASPGTAARRAQALGARLPPLLVAAERVAATVAQGVHGRRRVGQGDSFWQYRPFVPGDAAHRIDGRASGKSDRNYVRETEWEAAQTVALWRDGSPSMRWRSGAAMPDKVEHAELLLLALASLLLRGGVAVRLRLGPRRKHVHAVRWGAGCRRRCRLCGRIEEITKVIGRRQVGFSWG